MPEAPGVDLPGASRLFGYRLRGPSRNLGSDAPENVLVAKNRFRNDLDIFWDESGSNIRFRNNRCRTSTPAGLCD